MKYIITKNKAGMILPLVFDSHFRHKDIIKTIRVDHEIVSAGTCLVTVTQRGKGRVVCCGESRSLGTRSRPEPDERILTQLFFKCNLQPGFP
jgi:hypothetical protein